ncbi:MAG: hydrogenase maturation protease [bacterium]
MNRSAPRILVLGLGNTILSDDGIGIYAVRLLRELLEPDEPIDVKEAELGGFALVDLLEGYDACVLLDAFEGGCLPGELRVLELDAFAPTARLAAGHQIDLPTAIELGRTTGRQMPQRIAIVAVQVGDSRTLGESCTAPVQAAIEPAARRALELARSFADEV